MMTITQIYERYRLMPNLQLHQLRVAGVAKVITDNSTETINKTAIISACLLHDMGNIIKFDLELFPDFLEPAGLEYWQQIQEEFLDTYGKNEHHATMQIAEEIGASPETLHLIDQIGFAKAQQNYESDSLATKICAYSDMRVTPQGIVPLQRRLDDLEQRYYQRYPSDEDKEKRQQSRQYLQKIEEQIFTRSQITSEYVTDQTVEAELAVLKQWQIGS